MSEEMKSCCSVVKEKAGKSWRDYLPLIVLVVLAMLVGVAKQFSYGDGFEMQAWMHDFMGVFLVVFAMFKLFDVRGFADGFQKYDLLAKRFRGYAMVYPFLELGLGLWYLSMMEPRGVYVATICLMGFGALGVLSALKKGLDISCACMGSALDVPLSTVALLEDLGMVAMAVVMIVFAG